MSEFTISQQRLDTVAEAIFKAKLLKFGSFVLKSGITSPFYLDLRQAQSHPEAFHAIVDVYSDMLADTDPDVFLAGVPEAATPLAAATGYTLNRKLLQPRKVVKDHGTKSAVEGDFSEGDHVVLIDDLITKGDSKIEAIDQVKGAGLIIDKFIVLIDREQGGIDLVKNAGYDIEAAFTVSALIESLSRQGLIDDQQRQTVLDFIANN